MVNSYRDTNRMPEAIAVLDEAQDEWIEHLGEAIVEQINQGFDNGEDALGRPWEPLKTADGDILVDTGEMRDSIGYQMDSDNNIVGVGSSNEYIGYHEFGAGNLPRRPILEPALTWADEKLIVPSGKDIIGDSLDDVSF